MKQSGPNSLKAGDVVARRYVILRQLREEPCGGVWLAQDRLLGLDIGLKFLPRHSPQFDEVKGALRREAALALKLRHPHILGVLHYEEGEEGAYLIQEPFPGESLLAHLSRLERFRLPQSLTILEQVAQALAFAHDQHEVHQALDPFHVLIADQTVKLANFACPPKEEDDQVSHLELKAYMAPEVLQGEPVTPTANVFSLGILGFRLSAGSLPYPLTFDEPFPYRLESVPVDLGEIPLPLQNLLLQCLAPNPQDRFEDAGVFLDTLEQRREMWRTPSQEKWFGWTPENSRGAAARAAATRMLGRLWEGSKGAAGKLGQGWQSLKTRGDSGLARRWLLGLAGASLFLVLLVWGGRALLQKAEAPPAPSPPAPRELKLPQAGGPPLSAATEPAPPLGTSEAAPPAVSPAPGPAVQAPSPAPAKEDRYQLLVATYASLDQARALKQRLQAKKLPATLYRVTSNKKTFYLVKAGPFPGKKQAEDAARRLKSEENLAQTPKVVKVEAKAPKAETRRPSP